MIGTLLKIPLKLVKLQVKLALLPARTAIRLARQFRASDSRNEARPYSSGSQPAPPPPIDIEPVGLEVAPSEVMKRLEAGDEFVLIDVRQAQELANGGLIEGSLHIPSQDLPHRIDDLDKDCAHGVPREDDRHLQQYAEHEVKRVRPSEGGAQLK